MGEGIMFLQSVVWLSVRKTNKLLQTERTDCKLSVLFKTETKCGLLI